MVELLSLIFFGVIVYTFLVIVPATIEKFANEDFRNAYFSYLASKHLTTYGK